MQHIANAHPKVRCCGSLLNESDLDMHYLTSRNHPVCSKCNVGFPTEQEYAEVGGGGVPAIYERSEPYDDPVSPKYSTIQNCTPNCSAGFARSSSQQRAH
jgi:hypothetical protein